MARNEPRRIVQVGQDTSTPKQINEALRQLTSFITLLEGRQGQIDLKDGIKSNTSTPTAFESTALSLPDASFGVFYSGENGTDCWLASGAKLVGANEWVALKTRAAMLKLSNSAGPLAYFNTGLTPGASFIPIAQSSPVTPLTPHWGIWQDSTGSANPGPELVTWDTEIFADPAYFTRQTSNTEIAILIDGLYEVTCNTPFTINDASGNVAQFILNAGSFNEDGYWSDPSSAGTTLSGAFALHTIWTFSAGEVVTLNRNIAAPDAAASITASRILTIKLIQN